MGIGDLMFYSAGESLHQRTSGTSQWSIVSVDPKFFAGSSIALTGSEITPPPIGEALRPLPSNATKLRRLHAKACRLAETNPLKQSRIGKLPDLSNKKLFIRLSAASRRKQCGINRRSNVISAGYESA